MARASLWLLGACWAALTAAASGLEDALAAVQERVAAAQAPASLVADDRPKELPPSAKKTKTHLGGNGLNMTMRWRSEVEQEGKVMLGGWQQECSGGDKAEGECSFAAAEDVNPMHADVEFGWNVENAAKLIMNSTIEYDGKTLRLESTCAVCGQPCMLQAPFGPPYALSMPSCPVPARYRLVLPKMDFILVQPDHRMHTETQWSVQRVNNKTAFSLHLQLDM